MDTLDSRLTMPSADWKDLLRALSLYALRAPFSVRSSLFVRAGRQITTTCGKVYHFASPLRPDFIAS